MKHTKRLLVFASIMLIFHFAPSTSLRAQDSIFSHTHQGTTLYYIVDSTGDAMVVAPMWPDYDEENDEAWLGYTKPTGDVTVPDSVPFQGTMHAVTRVGHDAFYKCTEVTSINLPDAVKEMGSYAFGKCFSLTSFTVPMSLKSIPSQCFYVDTLLASFTFNDSITSIGYKAFHRCQSLFRINIPSSVTTIGTWAFNQCSGLYSVSIPGSVSTISERAFNECRGLEFVRIGEGVDTIGQAAFRQCSNLRSINYPSTLKKIGDFAFQYDSLLSSPLILPEGFTSQGVVSFGDCVSLPSATFPGTMDSIPSQSLWSCISLATVTIGEGVSLISQAAFVLCSELHMMEIPSTLDSIGDYAFYYGVPDTLVMHRGVPPALGDSVFTDYHSILIVPSGSVSAYRQHPVWGLFQYIIEVFPHTHQGTTLYYTLDTADNAMVVAPNFPVTLNDTNAWAGYVKPTGAVVVPDSVPYRGTMHAVNAVGDHAFFHCREITAITLPDSVNSIGTNAFAVCRALQSVNIPDGVTRLSYGCLQVCTSLQAIDIPASVRSIDQGAFYNCRGLKTVTFHEGLDSIGWMAFFWCAMERVTLPEGLRVIGYEAFDHNNNLRHVDLPSTLEVVWPNVFRECPLLDSVVFPDTMSKLGGGVVMDCPGLTYIHLPENLEELEAFLLYGTGIETFVVPPHVHTIQYQIFAECQHLHKVTLPASVTDLYWGLFDNTPLDTLILECTTPPALHDLHNSAINSDVFQQYTATLIVPCGAADAYRQHEIWGLFTDIVESCTGIDDAEPDNTPVIISVRAGRISVTDNRRVQVFDMTGRLVQTFTQTSTQALPTGVYLVKVGDQQAQKVVVTR